MISKEQVPAEGYYSEYLKGKPGSRLKQKLPVSWKPIDDPEAVEPVDGFDVYTTIDTRIQDVAQQSLLSQLKNIKPTTAVRLSWK